MEKRLSKYSVTGKFRCLLISLWLIIGIFYIHLRKHPDNIRRLKSKKSLLNNPTFNGNRISYCSSNNSQTPILWENLIYLPHLNVLFCNIPKTASTNLRRILYLTFNTNFYNRSKEENILELEKVNRAQVWFNIERQMFDPYYLKNYRDLTQRLEILESPSIFKFIFVRHPFQRIYSSFRDKFQNDNVDDTMFGWKDLEEDILTKMSNSTLTWIRRNDIRLDFDTFLKYIVYCIQHDQELNSHWDLIFRRCSLCHINYDWIGKFERIEKDASKLLEKFNISDKVSFPSWKLDQQTKYRIDEDDLLNLFINNGRKEYQTLSDYYKQDFIAFNYTIHEI
ncbi:unnamed protein product [Didymodactylos carnosus]|uniref:Carbohydrate sulfotransferase n=1 Tax=Didymodactylos carnosus TaxID=1234261 RepID=A0A813RDZ5_9BILA|nr:unnamed protein product [Didymodactylos carnosus]CAF0780746.1 unnamed protein product [Didymodactylos carnosus]CAF3500038.1 unnamed protein product [Didymodactylos carnosus]CAF3563930.1 unnamed protein product [Didymodactylos carnosus]